MRLNKLSLRDFRNYGEATVNLDPGVNLIVGDNAQGKTNLLEAVSYLGSGRSFRAQKNSEMIRFGAEFGEIYGEVHSQDRDQTLRWLLFPGRRQIFRNGAKSAPPESFPGCCRRFCSARRTWGCCEPVPAEGGGWRTMPFASCGPITMLLWPNMAGFWSKRAVF